MPSTATQISAYISASTLEDLDRYVEARGMKKAFVIEQALRHYLLALRELPSEVIVPPQLVVRGEAADHLMERVQKPRRPTPAMRRLFAKK
jgi:hypothetical protein